MCYGCNDSQKSRFCAIVGLGFILLLSIFCLKNLRLENAMPNTGKSHPLRMVRIEYDRLIEPIRPNQTDKKIASEDYALEMPSEAKKTETALKTSQKTTKKPIKQAEKAQKTHKKTAQNSEKKSAMEHLPPTQKNVSADTQAHSAASPTNAGQDPDQYAKAVSAIMRAIEKHKSYPKQGRRSGAEGLCKLAIKVGTDGKIAAVELTQYSGKSILDSAARRLGEKLVGIPVCEGSLSVVVPVRYALTDK